MSLHPLTVKVIDDLGASMQQAAERMEEMRARIADLEHQLLLSRPLRLRYDAENAVLEACMKVDPDHWRELAELRDYYTPEWVEHVARAVCALRGIEVRP